MAEPVVVEGQRGPEARGLYRKDLGLPVEAERLARVPPAQDGEAVFVSPHENYRIVLWEDWTNTEIGHGGVRRPDRREAQFRAGIYRTRDPREIGALRKATSFGINFYERAKLEEMAHAAKLEAAMAAAEDPEIAAALKTKLGVAEMPLPARDSAETKVKPIK